MWDRGPHAALARKIGHNTGHSGDDDHGPEQSSGGWDPRSVLVRSGVIGWSPGSSRLLELCLFTLPNPTHYEDASRPVLPGGGSVPGTPPSETCSVHSDPDQ
jgi:hypothetical protein